MSYIQSLGTLCKQSQKHRITSHSRRPSGLPPAAGKKIYHYRQESDNTTLVCKGAPCGETGKREESFPFPLLQSFLLEMLVKKHTLALCTNYLLIMLNDVNFLDFLHRFTGLHDFQKSWANGIQRFCFSFRGPTIQRKYNLYQTIYVQLSLVKLMNSGITYSGIYEQV